MTNPTRILRGALGNRAVSIFAWAAFVTVIAAVSFAAVGSPEREVGVRTITILFLTGFSVIGVSFYTIEVRRENKAFRQIPYLLHRVNHFYRDTLFAVLRLPARGNETAAERDYIEANAQIEREAITYGCAKIAHIFSLLTQSDCTVSVKLIATYSTDEKRVYCETYTRSETSCRRDSESPARFEIRTGKNTAFDGALVCSPGRVSHFHSRDLGLEENYHTERENWQAYYRSMIVVPIRYVYNRSSAQGLRSDDIGFLSIDTMSRNRLNNTWHVELLASFADQMYNFLSIMRGRYLLR